MKKGLAIIILLFLLSGCSSVKSPDRAMALRQNLMESSGCRFTAAVTADYGENIFQFSMECRAEQDGTLFFSAVAPDTISGICGEISADRGEITFDDQALAFPLMVDDQITPVSAPWVLIHSLRGAYISAGGQDGEFYRIMLDDSYQSDKVHLDVWLNEENLPVRGEILWKNRRILSLDLKDFQIMQHSVGESIE